jgi:hypothetical protein
MAGITGNTTGACIFDVADAGGVTIAKMTSLSISSSGTSIDCTSMDDTNAVYVAGIPDSGEVTIEANYVAATYRALELKRTAKTISTLTFIFSDSSDWACATAFITKLDATSPKDGVVTMSVTFKLSGAIVHVAT